jgi:hypothetical protein
MAYLGKRFQQYINDSLDGAYIAWALRGIEHLKLEILDACEYQERPPVFDNAGWLNHLYMNKPNYRFIWDELTSWLKLNGLDYNWEDRSTLAIKPHGYTDFEKVPELDLTSWMEKLKK